MIGREDEVRTYRERVGFFYYVVFFNLCLILARLVYLQILRGEELRKFSENNRLKKERLHANRGIIYDRNGKIIVENRASLDVVLLSQYYHSNEQTNSQLASVLKLEPEEFNRKLAKIARSAFYPLLLRADVSKDIVAAIEMAVVGDTFGFKGIDIEANVQRKYPFGEMGAQLLGYLGEVDPRDIKNAPKGELQPGDFIGKQGIERVYDSELRGVNGVGYMEVDAMGRRKKHETGEKLMGFVSQTEPIPGNNLVLTIDADLQIAAAQALSSRKFNGAVVALDPRSGEVLAMVSSPAYPPEMISAREISPKVWAQLRDNSERPLRNRTIQDHYPPGSTFKLIVALAALAEGVATEKTMFNCHGHLQFGKRKFNCWKRHGPIDFVRAIKESCDVFFYNLGLQLGVDRIAKYARAFGMGSRTGIKLSGEQTGLVPDSDWKFKRFKDRWHEGETLSVAIGQGFLDVTPIQLVKAYAAIGNGGFVYRPYLVKRIQDRTGEVIKEFHPEVSKIDIPIEAFKIVKLGLEKVVNEAGGTAFYHRSKKVVISGKTGTAQVRAFVDIMKKKCEEMEFKDRHHGLFVGYAPKDNPEIAVVAIAEHGCHGSAAAPVVRDIIDTYMDKVHPGSKVETVVPAPKAKPVVDADDEDQQSFPSTAEGKNEE